MFMQQDKWKRNFCAALGLFGVLAVSNLAQSQHVHPGAGKASELGATAASDAQGRVWMAAKQPGPDGTAAVILRRSDDMGKHWSDPVDVAQEPVAARGEERPKVAFGTRGEVYVLYTRPRAGGGNPHIGDIRFVRSTDGGKSFSQPVYPHANQDTIVHAFGAMIVDKAGNIFVAWIDSRDKEAAKAGQEPYTGNGLYYAVSKDAGKSFSGDYKIADHTCECCRLSLALDEKGQAVVMWRHVFAPNIRDHAIATLSLDGRPGKPVRATFDDWRVDACPHHGPSIAFGPDGVRHQAWFNMKGEQGAIFYAHAGKDGKLSTPVRLGSEQAKMPDVSVSGKQIVIVWKQFDGDATAMRAKLSVDGGRNWTEKELARTAGESDRPQVLHTAAGLAAAWPTQDEGMRIIPLLAHGKGQ